MCGSELRATCWTCVSLSCEHVASKQLVCPHHTQHSGVQCIATPCTAGSWCLTCRCCCAAGPQPHLPPARCGPMHHARIATPQPLSSLSTTSKLLDCVHVIASRVRGGAPDGRSCAWGTNGRLGQEEVLPTLAAQGLAEFHTGRRAEEVAGRRLGGERGAEE